MIYIATDIPVNIIYVNLLCMTVFFTGKAFKKQLVGLETSALVDYHVWNLSLDEGVVFLVVHHIHGRHSRRGTARRDVTRESVIV